MTNSDRFDAMIKHDNLVLFLQFLREKRERGETLTEAEKIWIREGKNVDIDDISTVPRVR